MADEVAPPEGGSLRAFPAATFRQDRLTSRQHRHQRRNLPGPAGAFLVVREAQRRGARLVVVDPMRTRTADAADWHQQIKPASDAALAMMHVIIRDGFRHCE
jgi:formylmethanofuran dehydrogenase subunit B